LTARRQRFAAMIGICTLLLVAGGTFLLLQQAAVSDPRTLYLRDLPRLDSSSRLYQVSSRDPNGWNKDRGQFLYQEAGRYMILDVYGSGAIERIWMTADDIANVGNIQLFFDEAITPTVDLPASDFFAGRTAPFLAPLVGGPELASGGHYSYLRLPFAHRVRVATTKLPWYYNIEYSLNSKPVAASFNGQSADPSQQLWQQVASGTLPIPFGGGKAADGSSLHSGTLTLAGGTERTLGSFEGPAAITALKLQWQADLKPPELNNLRLKIYWDGEGEAAVDAPLGFFFGSGMGEYEVRALPVGLDSGRHLGYSYFPMPFARHARLTLVNDGAQAARLNYEVESSDSLYQQGEIASLGYFYAHYNSASPPKRKLDYPLLQATGSGKYVGTTLVISGPVYLQEGNERVDVDGSQTSQLTGTGTEDYFNAAWGFQRGNFSLPSSGNPAGKFGGAVAAYRFYLADPLPWGRSLSFGFGHGGLGRNYPYDNDTYSYSSLAYSYQRATISLSQTDEISFGKLGNAAAHAYTNTAQVWSGTGVGYYERTEEKVADAGQAITATGALTFSLAVDPANRGVLLRRRLDYQTGFQRGRVSIDGQAAGVWYSPGNNTFRSWRDEEFVLPASLTQGKSQLTIRVDVERDRYLPATAAAWNEFHYWVYSMK